MLINASLSYTRDNFPVCSTFTLSSDSPDETTLEKLKGLGGSSRDLSRRCKTLSSAADVNLISVSISSSTSPSPSLVSGSSQRSIVNGKRQTE